MSSLVTEILANADQLDKFDLSAKLDALSHNKMKLKDEIYQLVQKKCVDFYSTLNNSIDLNNRVQELSSEMEAVANKVEKNTYAQLTMSAKEFHDLSAELSEIKAELRELVLLTSVMKAQDEFHESWQAGKYWQSSTALSEIHRILTERSGQVSADVKIIQVLINEYRISKEKLISDVTKAWLDTIRWEIGEHVDADVQVSLSIKCVEKQKESTKELLQAMYDLGLLYPKIKNFGDRFLKSVVEPVLQYADLGTNVKTSELKSTLSLFRKKAVVSQADQVSPDVCFDKLLLAVKFICEHLFNVEINVSDEEHNGNTKKVPLISILGSFINRAMIDLIISKCLSQSIPSKSSDLENYSCVIKKTEEFQSSLVALGLLQADDNTLASFVSNVNGLFANKKCQQILGQARSLMMAEMHSMVAISPQTSEELSPVDLDATSAKYSKQISVTLSNEVQLSPQTMQMPACRISASIEQLMKLAYSALQEAVSAPGSEQCSIQLFYVVRNVFVLFCNMMPVYHRDNLENLPQFAALHHNNCMFIAHCLLTMGHQFQAQLPAPLNQGMATFIDLVPKLRRLGTKAFLQQLIKQRDIILDSLSSAEGFANISEDNNYNKGEKSIQQVLLQIQRLSNVWSDVLPINMYYKSIGTLLDTALQEIISKIVALEDISADDASQLHSLMVPIKDRAPKYFEIKTSDNKESNPQSLLCAYVQRWNKLLELMWLLNANLRDIGDRWADGKGPLAAEFDASEVKQLIRALFQNTEKRSQVLASIK